MRERLACWIAPSLKRYMPQRDQVFVPVTRDLIKRGTGDWSAPLQARLIRIDDHTADLMFRTPQETMTDAN